MAKSVEQKLFEAYVNGEGTRLSPDDVWSLVNDDAVGTRITNKAGAEAGVPEQGTNTLPPGGIGSLTWDGFIALLSATHPTERK